MPRPPCEPCSQGEVGGLITDHWYGGFVRLKIKKVFIGLIGIFLISNLTSCFSFGSMDVTKDGNIALVEIKGVIIEPYEVLEDLEKAEKSKKAKAILVRVDSPGGAVAASQEIYHEIKRISHNVKPVVISMGDVAASGGYYVALGGTVIFANEGTITGSIGVRMELMNAQGLFEWARLKPETLKSGKYKDMGSMYRELTPEERSLFNSTLSELHSQFKEAVIRERNLNKEKVDEIAEGQIFTGTQAKELGLIDHLGGMNIAAEEAGKLGKIKGKAKLFKVRKKKSWWMEALSENAETALARLGFNVQNHKYFIYEWKPY